MARKRSCALLSFGAAVCSERLGVALTFVVAAGVDGDARPDMTAGESTVVGVRHGSVVGVDDVRIVVVM